MGANKLIRATSAPLGDYFSRKILGIFLKKVFKKTFKNLSKNICTILLRLLKEYVTYIVFGITKHYE
jgi:hypothetical protein